MHNLNHDPYTRLTEASVVTPAPAIVTARGATTSVSVKRRVDRPRYASVNRSGTQGHRHELGVDGRGTHIQAVEGWLTRVEGGCKNCEEQAESRKDAEEKHAMLHTQN